MNILCKIFGHSTYFNTSDITDPSYYKRWKCKHKEKGTVWERLPMPKTKSPKK